MIDPVSHTTYRIQSGLEHLRRFAAVKDLHITETFALSIMYALAGFAGDRVTLPLALQNIFFEGLQPSGSLREA